ncbi:hypothetical protein [Alkalitalea saponilacus]|nr:hypothetical protein [Alkalitalea saponilacus]ASB49256.1 hypothetical protein CDL62_08945 [Alkalitalea saponilacus]
METLIIKDTIFEFVNARQILNMGGPWVGDMNVDGKKSIGSVIIDNVVYYGMHDSIYFIKYYGDINCCFAVCLYDLSRKEIYKFDKAFDMIFIKEISDNKLVYFDAFHEENDKYRRELSLNDLERVLIKQ